MLVRSVYICYVNAASFRFGWLCIDVALTYRVNLIPIHEANFGLPAVERKKLLKPFSVSKIRLYLEDDLKEKDVNQ